MQSTGALAGRKLQDSLREGGLKLTVGPYTYCLQSKLSTVAEGLEALYCDYPVLPDDAFADYCVSVNHGGLLSRLQRKTEFRLDHQRTFGLIPLKQSYAFLEWGMNWCVSIYANEYLKLHAAVVARDNGAIVMPGIPGAGKSTLCAALALSGWRVLSDEHALISPGTTDVVPLCRPISLKNESIEIIKAFDRTAIFGPLCDDTHKGTVSHMKADMHPDSHERTALPIRAMVFPRYSTSDRQGLTPRPKSRSFILAAYHSFNYSLLAESGYHAMVKLIDTAECYDLVYRDLNWALNIVNALYSGRSGL